MKFFGKEFEKGEKKTITKKGENFEFIKQFLTMFVRS